jgi:hypothetical protein
MKRVLAFVVLGLILLYGSPYAALLLNQVMGPWSATAIEADGSTTWMEFGADLPRPDWVAVMPGADIVQASHLVSRQHPQGFGFLDLATRANDADVKAFYRARLEAAGFTVEDLGLGPLNAATAAYLGVAGTLQGTRAATSDQIAIQVGTLEGVVRPSRLLRIKWWKITAGDLTPAVRD